MELIIGFVLLVITYFTGTHIEKKHFRNLIAREKLIVHQPFTTDNFTAMDHSNIKKIGMVSESCVIGADYFKMFIASLRSLIGGPLSTYESLLDRARREAILRMREKARNADMIVETRIITSEIGPGIIEIQAYGTAIYLEK